MSVKGIVISRFDAEQFSSFRSRCNVVSSSEGFPLYDTRTLNAVVSERQQSPTCTGMLYAKVGSKLSERKACSGSNTN